MTATKRIFSGSVAAWSKIAVTLIGQVALVPIFLSHWTLDQYGCWLIIQSVTGLSTILSFGHQNFIGFEFLKCGVQNKQRLSLIFYSAIPYALILGLIELSIIILLVYFGFLNSIFDPTNKLDTSLIKEATSALIIQSIIWLLISCIGGLAGRLLAPLGYYPRNAWWGVWGAIITLLASIIALLLGEGILMTTVAIAMANLFYNIPLYFDFWNILTKNNIYPVKPDWSLGFRNIKKSFAVAINTFLELLRQQGLRIFLSALVGIKEMTAFSTMRTASNIVMQGIGTITNPILPELMRFLKSNDQDRTDATLAFVWFTTVILLAPTLVVLQYIMPDIFSMWTRGKVEYDPTVFGLFSVALIIYAIGQPAVAVLQGNNLLKEQLFISVLTTLIVIFGVIYFTPKLGVQGAAKVLVLAEGISCLFLVYFATRWLRKNKMLWSWKMFSLTLITALIAVVLIYVKANYQTINNIYLSASALLFLIFFLYIFFCIN